jgi:hypothetical protein
VTEGPPPIEPALQLAILAPTSASIGEGFDMRVTIAARKAVGRIVVEIAYDPILLKARSTEEIDSTGRPPGERAFSIERMSDGQIAVVMPAQGGAAGQELPASAVLAQFEAIATGSTQIRVSGVTVTDTTGQALPWAATGEESQIIVN